MIEAFWACAALVLYTYFGYPLLVFVVSALRHRPTRTASNHPAVTFIVAAHNEALVIEQKLNNTLSLRYPAGRLEIIVASDGSTDDTNALVRGYERHGVALLAPSVRRGKNALLNEVVPTARGEVVVISDANIILASDALERLMRPFADPQVGGAWGNKIYRNPGGTAGGEGEALYLRYEKYLKSRESRIGSIVAGECSCLAFRRELFRRLPLDVPDDFALSTNVVWQGHRMVYAQDALSYEDTSPTDRDEFRRKIRIIERGVRGFFRVLPLANPARTGFYAVSLITRQFLRRIAGGLLVFIVFALPFLWGEGLMYRLASLACGVLLLLAGVGLVARGRLRRLPLVYIPYYLSMVNVAALIGVARVVFGYRSVSWRPTGRAGG